MQLNHLSILDQFESSPEILACSIDYTHNFKWPIAQTASHIIEVAKTTREEC